MTTAQLTIDFMGTAHIVTSGFTFGRDAHLVLDPDNQYLHGVAGRFLAGPDGWSIQNAGTRLHLKVVSRRGQIIELPPGASSDLPPGPGVIRVKAGPTPYELAYELTGAEQGGAQGGAQSTDAGGGQAPAAATGTLPYGRALTPAQLRYALTLAEPRLRAWTLRLPTAAEIGQRWGVSERTVSHALEDIRARLRQAGVRRISAPEQLVEYLVVNRIVTLDQLDHLTDDSHPPSGPRAGRGDDRCSCPSPDTPARHDP